ncbi:hypothetical protein P7K49_023798, partial [Saguinus oedipus]
YATPSATTTTGGAYKTITRGVVVKTRLDLCLVQERPGTAEHVSSYRELPQPPQGSSLQLTR